MLSVNEISVLNFMMSPGDKLVSPEDQTLGNQQLKVNQDELRFVTQMDVWSPNNLSGKRAIIERVSGLDSIEAISQDGKNIPDYHYLLIDEQAFGVELVNTARQILFGTFQISNDDLNKYAKQGQLLIQFLLTNNDFNPAERKTANGKVFFETLIKYTR